MNKINQVKKAQAATELAILGALILVVFGAILSYGQRFDFRQAVKMEAFRKALRTAYYLNGAVSYNVQRDSRQADLTSGFGQGQASSANGSTSLIWSKGVSGHANGYGDDDLVLAAKALGPEARNWTDGNNSIYEINGKVINLPKYLKTVIDHTGEKQQISAPVNVYNQQMHRTTNYTETATDQEDQSGTISNYRKAILKEKQKAKLALRFDYNTRDSRENALDYIPMYAYEGQSYDFDDESGTIKPIPEITTYAGLENNRIVFQENDTTVDTSRTWVTNK